MKLKENDSSFLGLMSSFNSYLSLNKKREKPKFDMTSIMKYRNQVGLTRIRIRPLIKNRTRIQPARKKLGYGLELFGSSLVIYPVLKVATASVYIMHGTYIGW